MDWNEHKFFCSVFVMELCCISRMIEEAEASWDLVIFILLLE